MSLQSELCGAIIRPYRRLTIIRETIGVLREKMLENEDTLKIYVTYVSTMTIQGLI